ncbi:MAG: septum formation initiator family protein [Bacteroidia bacterium]|nr:septum formation initiator family protein [Bacteroidia bacterium]
MKNKYILTTLIFLLILIFFSQNNLINRYKDIKYLERLRTDKEFYIKAIHNAEKKIYELKTNKESLEKFAREEYLMKKPDEDIFVVVKEED